MNEKQCRMCIEAGVIAFEESKDLKPKLDRTVKLFLVDEVHIVVQFAEKRGEETRIVGTYADRNLALQHALGLQAKLRGQGKKNHIAVLKQRIRGL